MNQDKPIAGKSIGANIEKYREIKQIAARVEGFLSSVLPIFGSVSGEKYAQAWRMKKVCREITILPFTPEVEDPHKFAIHVHSMWLHASTAISFLNTEISSLPLVMRTGAQEFIQEVVGDLNEIK